MSFFLLTGNGDGGSPEETVQTFLTATAEGQCAAAVEMVTDNALPDLWWGVADRQEAVEACEASSSLDTQEGWATNWEAFTREDALAACQRTSVAEPSDIPDDDLQATLNSAVLVADDGNQATVQLTIFNPEEVVELEYLLVMVEGDWRIDDIRERFGDLSGPDSTLDFGLEAGPPTSPPSGDPELDPLAQECYQGNMDACDMVFLRSEIGSQYEDYGLSCGGRLPEPAGSCIIAVPDPLPPG